MNLEQFQIKDYQRLIELWKLAELSIRPRGRDSIKNIEHQMSLPTNYFLVAKEDNEIIGFVMAAHNNRKGWINRLAVSPRFQNQGIATKLIAESERLLTNDGINIIACLIENWNNISMELFAKLGFIHHKDISYFTKRESSEI